MILNTPLMTIRKTVFVKLFILDAGQGGRNENRGSGGEVGVISRIYGALDSICGEGGNETLLAQG